MKTRSQKGFSLIELIVVIIIVGIISILAIPRWFSGTSTLNNETDRLVNNFLFIQEMAINNGKNSYISINESNNSYAGYLVNAGGDIKIFNSINIDNSISITSSSITVEFDGLYGKPTNGTGYTINMLLDSKTNVIDINNNGSLTTDYLR